MYVCIYVCLFRLHDAGYAQLILKSVTWSRVIPHKTLRKGLIKEQLNRELFDLKYIPMQGRLIDDDDDDKGADYLNS